jgi:excisionase family DNA binding protein
MNGDKPMQPLLLTIRGAAETLSIGKTSLYRLLGAQRLTAIKIGRRTLVTVASVQALIDGSSLPNSRKGDGHA